MSQNPFPTPPPHAVAFAFKLADGSINPMGWMSLSLYKAAGSLVKLTPDMGVVFAFGDYFGPIGRDLAWAGVRELCARIEACGASPELTHAVTLASDLMQAIGNVDNPANQHAKERVAYAVLQSKDPPPLSRAQQRARLRELLENKATDAELVVFFNERGVYEMFGSHGDHMGWTARQTAEHFAAEADNA